VSQLRPGEPETWVQGLQSQERIGSGDVIRCPGCGGRNDATARVCEWCGRSFVTEYRQRSRTWVIPVGGVVIGMFAVLLVALVYASMRAQQPSTRVADEPPAAAAPPAEILERPPLVEATVVAAPTERASETAPTPSAAPTAQITVVPVVEYVRVANTDRIGAFIRREPQSNAPGIVAQREGAILRIAGPDTTVAGRVWRQVEDPRGNRGWTPAEYLVPSATGF
jgi:hypothetical protein